MRCSRVQSPPKLHVRRVLLVAIVGRFSVGRRCRTTFRLQAGPSVGRAAKGLDRGGQGVTNVERLGRLAFDLIVGLATLWMQTRCIRVSEGR